MEEVTLVQLARRCEADPVIVDLLQDAIDKVRETTGQIFAEDVPARSYFVHNTGICDFCLGPIFGIAYKCTVCTDYDACSKCKPSYGLFHDVAHRMPPPEGETGEIHELVAREGWKNHQSRLASPSQGVDVERANTEGTGEVKLNDDEEGSEKAVV
ncbi:hypothetical protein F5X68DRAFT_235159 [Plectosphaerella plurivora]|uniref:ZZ-type domain-containing protein n=1 Tax=Plectosphaerella plurivora TaxID=936078 RepID=A0A9P8V5J1_9PEZI|nr:hypothetical protein F5X68DRAFT_235159 [Plectosphaerella plurivora]